MKTIINNHLGRIFKGLVFYWCPSRSYIFISQQQIFSLWCDL